ncbi:MAG TPA: Nif3-like dinuclear metal center hexameric protein [Geobacteraceae bacterium]|nr:Nif3-like dinuclear metal center hexameric protein [Geobacteraceae bacterium]
MNPKVSDVVGIINKLAPFSFAEDWDNSGLQVGDPDSPVGRLMISLDACRESVESAIDKQCQLLLTHHPFLFKPTKRINLSHYSGHLIKLAIKNDLSIVSMHTNYDIAEAGINDLLAQYIGLKSSEPLTTTGWDELVKLVVFVPAGHEEKVLEALFQFSGFIGNYSDCSFQASGTGTFKPLAGANPFIGKINTREYARETRVEVLVRKEDMSEAVAALIKAHPYEEPAFDLHPLLNRGKSRGLGRIGELEKSVSLDVFARQIKEVFSLEGLRIVGAGNREIKRVAVCGGSGASLLRDADRQGADVLVTGDVKYHDARDAQALGLALVDIGHFHSEVLMIRELAPRLAQELAKKRYDVEIFSCDLERDPFAYL